MLLRWLHGYRRTLCPSHVSYWPAKLRWLERHHASPVSAARFADAKDYFFELITGERWTDPMTAASTGVFDSDGWCWDAALLAASGVGAGQLPDIREATAHAPLRAGAAAALGLPEGLPVVLGMDGPLAQLGAAGFSDRIATCTVGTSITFRPAVAARTPDPAQRLWCYPISRDHWVVGGAGSNGGNVLDWSAKLFGAEARLGDLLSDALALPIDPALVFLPYLNGERSPLWRDDLRGALVGLASHHGPVDVARAALDGVAGAVQELAAAVAACVTEPAEVRLTGGFLHDDRWAQLVTDALGVATSVPDRGKPRPLARRCWGGSHSVAPHPDSCRRPGPRRNGHPTPPRTPLSRRRARSCVTCGGSCSPLLDRGPVPGRSATGWGRVIQRVRGTRPGRMSPRPAELGAAGPALEDRVELCLEHLNHRERRVDQPLQLHAVHQGENAAGLDLDLLVVHRYDLAEFPGLPETADAQIDDTLVPLDGPIPRRVLRIAGLGGEGQQEFDEPGLDRVVVHQAREPAEVLQTVGPVEVVVVVLLPVHQDRLEQAVLVLEVPGQGGWCDTDVVGDLPQRTPRVPVAGEDPRRGVHDLAAAPDPLLIRTAGNRHSGHVSTLWLARPVTMVRRAREEVGARTIRKTSMPNG